jgi:tRNA threonylcarbamoyladenosine biosynthesis protein TsaB
MRVLAIETSTLAGGVALCEDGRVVGSSLLNVSLTHSERLMSMVDRLLEDCRWSLDRVQGLAVSIGPGSFTGLRVGAATVKGLALALGLPVAAVPTLDALAANVPFADAPVCPLLDARKGEVYSCLYQWTGDAMERRSEYRALPPQEIAEWLRAPVIVLGDGVAACRPYLERLGGGVRAAPAAQSVPSAAVIGQIGHAMLASGHGVTGDALEPLYLRPSEAEMKARRG